MKKEIAILVITTAALLALIIIVISSALAQEPLLNVCTFHPLLTGDGSGVGGSVGDAIPPCLESHPDSTPLPHTTICHKPGKNQVTLSVAPPAVDAHMNHGDYLDECLPWTPLATSTPQKPPPPTSTPSRPRS